MPGQTLYGFYERVQVNYSLGLPGYKRAIGSGTGCGAGTPKKKGGLLPPRFAIGRLANPFLGGETLPPAAVSQDPAEHEAAHPAAGAAGLDAAREDADGKRAKGRERQGGNGGEDAHAQENGPNVGAKKHAEEQAGDKRRRKPKKRRRRRRLDRGQGRLWVRILDVEICYAHFTALPKSFSLRDNSTRPMPWTLIVLDLKIRSAPTVGLASSASCSI